MPVTAGISQPGEFLAVLNALAGTQGWGEDAAASKYAGLKGTFPCLYALNVKAGTTGQGLNAVCNIIAGTQGLEAQQALSTKLGSRP